MKHDRRKCLYCNKPINRHEMLYGACSACMKAKAKAKHYGPHNNDKGTWLYADMAPRMVEYVDPHDMDDRGTMLLYNAINADTGVFNKPVDYDAMPAWDENGDPIPQKRHNKPMLFRAQRQKPLPPIPNGMKQCSRCGKLIPVAGYTKCDRCRKISSDSTKKWRDKLLKEHKCTRCSKELPPDYKFATCAECRAADRKRKEEREDIL